MRTTIDAILVSLLLNLNTRKQINIRFLSLSFDICLLARILEKRKCTRSRQILVMLTVMTAFIVVSRSIFLAGNVA